MELTPIAGGNCGRDDCPTVFMTDKGTIAVKGYTVYEETAAGEAVVEIPIAVFLETVRALGR
jgi:hypothetical protein